MNWFEARRLRCARLKSRTHSVARERRIMARDWRLRHERKRRFARCRGQVQRAEAGPARLAGADGGRRRGDAHLGRRARARDRRHRRYLPAQDRQPGGAVRRRARLSQGSPHPGQHPHLDPPHQSHAGPSGRRHRDRTGAALAQLHEGSQDHSAGRGARPARCWKTSRPATTSTCSRSRCRAGTSTTAAITSAPATWW